MTQFNGEGLKLFFETLGILKRRFYFWDGLVGSVLLFVGIFQGLIAVLKEPIKTVVRHNVSFIQPNQLSLGGLIIQGVVVLFIIGIWFYKRRLPRFKKNTVGILFSTSNHDELDAEVLELQKRVRTELKQRDLLNLIMVKALPPNIRITDAMAAHNALNKAKATLVVWGYFETSQVRGKKVAGFPKIHFTCPSPAGPPSDFHNEAALSILGRKWMFEVENEFAEKALVVRDITHVALHLVGLALLLKGHFEKAEAVFAVLDVDLEQARTDALAPPFVRSFCASVRRNHVRAIDASVMVMYRNMFDGQGVYHFTTPELSQLKNKILNAVRLDKRDSRLFIYLGIFSFLLGEINEAIVAITNAQECAPVADPSPDFSLGFLHVYQGDFKKARYYYKTGLAKKGSHNPGFINEIIEFIDQTLEQNPSKHQLHFVLALLNDERMDRSRAQEEYGLYIQKAKGDAAHATFVKEAERRLSRLIRGI